MLLLIITGGVVVIGGAGYGCYQLHLMSLSKHNYSPFNLKEAGFFFFSAACLAFLIIILPDGFRGFLPFLETIVSFEITKNDLTALVLLFCATGSLLWGFERISIRSNYLISVVSGTAMFVVSFVVIFIVVFYLLMKISDKKKK